MNSIWIYLRQTHKPAQKPTKNLTPTTLMKKLLQNLSSYMIRNFLLVSSLSTVMPSEIHLLLNQQCPSAPRDHHLPDTPRLGWASCAAPGSPLPALPIHLTPTEFIWRTQELDPGGVTLLKQTGCWWGPVLVSFAFLGAHLLLWDLSSRVFHSGFWVWFVFFISFLELYNQNCICLLSV